MSDGCSGKPSFDSCFWLRSRFICRLRSATPVMSEDTVLPFHLPSVCRKKLSVGFDGGQLSSDAGVLLLRGIEKRLGIVTRLASCLRDKRDPDLILHTVEEMLRLRMFAIAAGYEGTSGKPVAVILREGKTPAGREVRTILKHVIGRIRGHWPEVRILVRGDSHYGRVEAMEWCEEHGVDYIFGFGGNAVLKAMTQEAADVLCVERAARAAAKLRSFATLGYGAKGWNKERCIAGRIEATPNGLDIRYVVTSLNGTAKHLYETVYCGRGRCENFIKWHKAQLASDRTSCRDPKANQFRLILHTAAYWLMLTARNAIAKRLPLAVAEFATLRLRLIKIAARVIEGTARIRVHLPTACPDRAVFRQLAGRLCAAGP